VRLGGFATRSPISSRSDLVHFTSGIRFGSTMVRGIGGSTRILFVNAIDSSMSASRSAFQLVMAVSPNAQPIEARTALPGVDTVDIADNCLDPGPTGIAFSISH
jgi:hypothetical protein